jgi:hypothetical protein
MEQLCSITHCSLHQVWPAFVSHSIFLSFVSCCCSDGREEVSAPCVLAPVKKPMCRACLALLHVSVKAGLGCSCRWHVHKCSYLLGVTGKQVHKQGLLNQGFTSSPDTGNGLYGDPAHAKEPPTWSNVRVSKRRGLPMSHDSRLHT